MDAPENQPHSTPLSRPRAPTIALDTSMVNGEPDRDSHAPLATPPIHRDENTLAIPTRTSRSQSQGSSTLNFSPSSKGHASSDDLNPRSSPAVSSLYVDTKDALKPDPGEESLFEVKDNPFAFAPGQLSKIINPKSVPAFLALGGLVGLEKGLRTDSKSGLSNEEAHLTGSVSFEEATASATQEDNLSPAPSPSPGPKDDASPFTPVKPRRTGTRLTFDQSKDHDAFVDRRRVYGENRLPDRKSRSLLQLAWIALQDKVLILLSVAAVVSLALGLYQTFGAKHDADDGAKVEWVEGVAIIVAIAIVVVVGALNDWQKERQFQKLNKKKEDRLVNVVRSGKLGKLSIFDVMVGDVMHIEQGDVIPVDGVYIEGHSLSCDESSATGESDLVKKTPAAALVQALRDKDPAARKMDPFLLSGAKVLDGVGSILVTAVGPNSSHGRTMMALRDDPGLTPLQAKLNILAGYIAKLGGGAGLLLFVVCFIEFLARLPGNTGSPDHKAQSFLRILIIAITVIVVAVPEGLPLAVTLSLAYATRKMTRENNLVRHLQSCETMGNATVICSDKTGTLTENVMTVVAGAFGDGRYQFGDKVDVGAGGEVTAVDASNLSSRLPADVRTLLTESIVTNTTAFEGEEKGKVVFVGTKTETALLDWLRANLSLGSVATERANYPLIQLFPFNSKRKCMGAVVRLANNRYRLFIKGAPEIVLPECSKAIGDPDSGIGARALDDQGRQQIRNVISQYASRSFRTLAITYKEFDRWPPPNARTEPDNPENAEFRDVFHDLTWLMLVAIQDPVRKGVAKAVEDCALASVSVKMVTGDNIETARAIAKECGILKEGGIVMEGSDFRRLDQGRMRETVKNLCVLARSSPEDKRILVKCLRSLGDIVAVTGDGTNDAPALKAADVGFSMGITGTEVAKEASDIILMDDNFSSIVIALSWGRAINDSVKKFLQFQITVNITAVFLTFISAVSSDNEQSVLNAVQLLWVNLIMDTFAALALATDPPNHSLLDRKPEPKTAPLITLTMWKMIIGQSIYQLTVGLVLYYAGPHFLDYPSLELSTLIFNVFVFMQIFKLVNSRRIDNKLNIFEGLHKNRAFMLMMSIMVGGQVLIIFFGSDAFVVTRLNGAQWGISIVLGFFSIPVGILIRLFPDEWIRIAISKLPSIRFRRRSAADGSDAERRDIPDALLGIRDDLAFIKKVKGGRIRLLSHAIVKRDMSQFSRSPSRSSNRPSLSPLQSVLGMPGLLAASIGAHSPVETRSTHHRSDSSGSNPRATSGDSLANDGGDKGLKTADQGDGGKEELSPDEVEQPSKE